MPAEEIQIGRSLRDARRRRGLTLKAVAQEAGVTESFLSQVERDIASRTTTPPRALPRAASGLRGRDSELAAVQRLITHERLVTVLGPGGVGKSALVAEVAIRAAFKAIDAGYQVAVLVPTSDGWVRSSRRCDHRRPPGSGGCRGGKA